MLFTAPKIHFLRPRWGRQAMVRKLIEWSLNSPLIVILIAVTFATVGIFSFLNVNVEAYPDPAPAIVEVLALFPGASAEEVERQVTIPLEVTFAGMPGLNSIHSKSLFGLSDLKMNWNYGSQWTYEAARQEVINRMTTISQPLPPGVSPQISPESPTGEIYRYVLKSPLTRPVRFKLTNESLAELRAADVPQAILNKLNRLKGREFEVRTDLVPELAKILGRQEVEEFQGPILSSARQTTPNEIYTLN